MKTICRLLELSFHDVFWFLRKRSIDRGFGSRFGNLTK